MCHHRRYVGMSGGPIYSGWGGTQHRGFGRLRHHQHQRHHHRRCFQRTNLDPTLTAAVTAPVIITDTIATPPSAQQGEPAYRDVASPLSDDPPPYPASIKETLDPSDTV